jgi:HEAT repeat protein
LLFVLGLLLAGCGEPEKVYMNRGARAWMKDLKHQSSTERARAAFAVGQIGPPQASAAIPDLTELLTDSAPLVRQMAATALGQFGPEAKMAVPTLLQMAKTDREPRVRLEAAKALERIDMEAAEQLEDGHGHAGNR